ncbi:tetratricopeptide repeat protein [Candidatus Parabeggiatoa sp. HSG14]|uniref:OmpA family protein n=1 Tax=Candidatus Parabeggiatoa sp. HSG14 TaxID=3055593 RepID=UPI0025A8DBC2|nr:OmpA family protein [Thiotrichales bacterium HSG14]
MYPKIITLIFLISPLPLLATPCNQATQLVIQAYDLGEHAKVYALQKALLQQALNLCPNHTDAHNNLGVVLENEQNYPKAIHHYQRALQINPDYYEAWVGMGDIYYKQGQFPLSLDAYLNACTRDSPVRNQRITELLDKNNYRTATDKNMLKQASLSLLYDKQALEKLRQKVTDCRSRYRGIAPTLVPNTLLETFVVFRNIHFEVGEYLLTPTAEQQLDEISNTLLKKDMKSIQVSGHTDIQIFKSVPPEESDERQLRLSQQRAVSVVNALAKRNIPINKITTKGYGYTQPAQGYTEADWDKNRRVEIEIK